MTSTVNEAVVGRRAYAFCDSPTLPSTPAERQRRYRQRQREGLLYAVADVPLHLAEGLVEAGLLRQQDATDTRALGTALIRASERLVKKNRNAVTHKGSQEG